MSLFDAPTWDEQLADDDTPRMLEYGREYVAIGPVDGSKLGPANRIKVVGLIDGHDGGAIGYAVEGQRLPAKIVMFGCERFWRPT